ncbi:NAD(P)-dependent oxidoreductase [Candidatus Desulfarcum epimagneticum]|uniref:NAD(P)-dependent oxidoreductase n=1 Tax=uncultured Desulfobacteraceae bacterium TaxID=218296 RepID=A0A484HHY4_9BACT|nr:NAD(P)-dependent oxidoreductase [uncultured Desulfobacteraceae bacterium]
MTNARRILLTGAAGYIGGRLFDILKQRGFKLTCLVRPFENYRRLEDGETRIVFGDALDRDSLKDVFEGVDTAFYLIHSLGSKKDFRDLDRAAAENFSQSAFEGGVRRVIYLGGLAAPDEDVSDHLKSRIETGDCLRKTGVQVIEFRASIILGSGSVSFEMIRGLVERLPVMVTPRWVRVEAQPISVDDVLSYLSAAVDLETDENRVYEIGGESRVAYMDIMKEYARRRGLKRLMLPVPFLSLKLSSYWLALVTPLYADVGRKLIEGVRSPTVVRDPAASRDFDVRPVSFAKAIENALAHEDRMFEKTPWSKLSESPAAAPKKWGGVRFGNRVAESEVRNVEAGPEKIFDIISGPGPFEGFAWRLRGWMDRMAGGPGLRRDRKAPADLRPGETLDFWRVEAWEPFKRLKLLSEMKTPGRAWLEFEATPLPDGKTRLRRTVIYDPKGLWGLAYWHLVFPLHHLVFSAMTGRVARKAEEAEKG